MVLENENKAHSAYEQFMQNPTKDNLTNVVRGLEPTINYSLIKFNAADDPLIRSKARLITAKAVANFDPTAGSSLETFVTSYLQKLNRDVRDYRNPMKIPERDYVAYHTLESRKKEFEDKYGKEPDVSELADYSGIPIKKIRQINRAQWKMSSEGAMEASTSDEDDNRGVDSITGDEVNFESEALRYVFQSASGIDKKILQYATGLDGKKPLSASEIALKLNLSPASVTRRNQALASQIKKIEESLIRINK